MLKIIERNKKLLRMPKSWVNVFLFFPLAVPLIKWFAKLKIKPNFVTSFSGLLAIVAAFFFWNGSHFYLIIGALFFYLSVLLDQVDGNLSRFTNQQTEFGASFDGFMDSMRKIICFCPLLYSQFYLRGGINLLILGIVLVVLHYAMHIAFNLLKHRDFQLTKFGIRMLAKGVSPHFFAKSEEQFLIFVIGPALNQFIIVFCIGLMLFFFLALLVKIKIFLFKGKGW